MTRVEGHAHDLDAGGGGLSLLGYDRYSIRTMTSSIPQGGFYGDAERKGRFHSGVDPCR